MRGLQPGRCYEVSGAELEFYAGNYRHYHEWRDALARRALGRPAASGHDLFALSPEMPFYELIFFSDCEGTIGPDAAADLAEDFRAMRAKVLSQPLADPEAEAWFVERYDQWAAAFELASRGRGLVLFH